jgi:hypothetical protein
MTMATSKPASEKTLKWLHDLIVGKQEQGIADFAASLPPDWKALWDRVVSGFANCDHEEYGPEALNQWFAMEEWPLLEQSDASKFINALKDLPWADKAKAETAREPITEDGMYCLNGNEIFKVKWNQAKSNMYAERLVVIDSQTGGIRKGGHVKVKFVYERGAIMKLSPSDKMTYEQAKEFGALYGTCVNCGRLLTNELSIALGIGPICGRRQFGGEFEFLLDEAKLRIHAAGGVNP